MKKAKSFFLNTVLLASTSLFIRTIGVSFTAYLFRKIGSVGIGIYQLIMSVYALAITLATSGIKFTATRLISEEMGKNRPFGVKKAVRTCLIYSLCFSLLTALLLFVFAEQIGRGWLNDSRTIPSLKLLSTALPFVAVSAVLNGYFTAARKSAKSAFIQISDQFIMIGVTVTLLTAVLPQGITYSCLALVIGSCISEFASCFFLFLCWLWDRRKLKQDSHGSLPMTKRMLTISLPIAFSAYARSGLSTIQNILIPKGLRRSGASKEGAFTAYGTVHGMVLPTILYPSALLIALAELLIPELTECQVNKNTKQIHYIVTRVLKMSLLFSVCIMGILFCFSGELGNSIYQSTEVSFYLKIFAPLVLVMYMDMVVDGMLKGLGEQFRSMKYNVIDSFCSVLMVYFLLPALGIRGYVITVMVSEVLNFSLSLNRLIQITEIRLHLFNTLLKPILCVIGTGIFSMLFPTNLIIGILLFIGLYLLLLVLTSCLDKDDLFWIFRLFR